MHNIICGRWRRSHQICHFLLQVGHRQQFPDQCARSCPPLYLLLKPLSSRIIAVLVILRQHHHLTSLLLSSSSRLSATFLFMMFQSPRFSAIISAAILIHRPFHLMCLLLLSSSTYIYHDVLICYPLHHPPSLPKSYLFAYISTSYLMLLYP